jgi:hypothetical protein
VPDWHLDPRVFRRISSLWGPPQIDHFALRQSTLTTRFMSWRAADSPEAIDALSMRLDYALAYLFPPIPLLKRVVRKLEVSRGTFLLITPYWEARTWFASLQVLKYFASNSSSGRPTSPLPRQTRRRPLDGGAPSISGAALSSRLEVLRGLSRQDGSDPQRINTKGPGNPSSPSCMLPPFLSVKPL